MNSDPVAISPFLLAAPNTQAAIRLFCLPYAGVGASVYHRWSEELPREVHVCPIQLPGRESRFREPPFRSITSLVDQLAEALESWTNLPYGIFGHSMGATVGFDLARRLRRNYGRNPVCLFFSGRRAPQIGERTGSIHQLPDEEFVKQLQLLYEGIPEFVLKDKELMDLFLPIIKADVSLLESYVYIPEDPFSCPLSVFGGVDDRHVDHEHLEAWRAQTLGPFRVHRFPGNHFYIKDARQQLLQAVSDDLNEVLGDAKT